MIGPFTALLGLLVLVACLAIGAVAGRASRREIGREIARHPALLPFARGAAHANLLASAIALAAAALSCRFGTLGVGMVVAPLVGGVVFVLTLAAHEFVGRDVARHDGNAALELRPLRRYLPRTATLPALGVMIGLTIALATATITASPDDMGRPGRSLGHTSSTGEMLGGAGPWPGSFYSVPIAIGALLLIAATLIAARAVTRRPRDASDRLLVEADDALRRLSLRSVIVGATAALALTAVGIGAEMSWAISVTPAPHPVWLTALGAFCPALVVVSLGVALWSLSVLLLPVTPEARTISGRPAWETP